MEKMTPLRTASFILIGILIGYFGALLFIGGHRAVLRDPTKYIRMVNLVQHDEYFEAGESTSLLQTNTPTQLGLDMTSAFITTTDALTEKSPDEKTSKRRPTKSQAIETQSDTTKSDTESQSGTGRRKTDDKAHSDAARGDTTSQVADVKSDTRSQDGSTRNDHESRDSAVTNNNNSQPKDTTAKTETDRKSSAPTFEETTQFAVTEGPDEMTREKLQIPRKSQSDRQSEKGAASNGAKQLSVAANKPHENRTDVEASIAVMDIKRNEMRKAKLTELCNKFHIVTDVKLSESKIYHNPDLVLCVPKKVGTTTWISLMFAVSKVEEQYKEQCGKIINDKDRWLCAYSKTWLDRSVHHTLLLEKLAQQGYKTAVFTRNPWSRLVSGWKDKVVEGRGREEKLGKCTELKVAGTPCSFEEFVYEMLILVRTHKSLNGHFTSQYSHCPVCQHNYTFIGRTETMKEDGRSLLRLLKAPPGPWDDQFPVTNIQDKHKPPNYYSEYYKPFNSSIIKELQRFFRLDCVLNGYPISPFEPEYIDYKL